MFLGQPAGLFTRLFKNSRSPLAIPLTVLTTRCLVDALEVETVGADALAAGAADCNVNGALWLGGPIFLPRELHSDLSEGLSLDDLFNSVEDLRLCHFDLS
jgi:hypothetical protein